MSKRLHEITDYYCDDFLYPVKKIGNIYQVWSDESKFYDYYGVSLVIFDNKNSDKITQANGELYNLVNEMNLTKIHFTDIFGNTSKFTSEEKEYFTNKYINILKPLKLTSLSYVEKEKNAITKFLISKNNKKDILINIFLNSLFHFCLHLNNDDIVLIFKEQSGNYHDSHVISIHIDLIDVINTIHNAIPDKYLSFCKFPQEFKKGSYLKDSTSDFIAYSSCIIQNKIDLGMTFPDLEKKFKFLLTIYREAFNIMELPSTEFIKLISTFY